MNKCAECVMEKRSFGKYTSFSNSRLIKRILEQSSSNEMDFFFVDVIVALFCFIPTLPWTNILVKWDIKELF